MKMKVKPERNPFVAQMRLKRSGPHNKTKKYDRAKNKAQMKKELHNV